jgi:hypothetical protein
MLLLKSDQLKCNEARFREIQQEIEATAVARDAELKHFKDLLSNTEDELSNTEAKLSNTEHVLMIKSDQLKFYEERFIEARHELAVSSARRADSEKALADLRKLLEERALKKIPVRKPKA